MKKKMNVFLLGMGVFFLINTKPSYSFSENIRQKLDTTAQNLLYKYKMPGFVVGVWIPGKGEWVQALGMADKKTKDKMTIADHFRIGSVTKTMTVTGLLLLVDEGKLSLDDKINEYIENVPNGDTITLRMLANMTSGLPNYTANESWQESLKNKLRVWKHQELLDAAFSLPILFPPGEKFYYSNTNTLLLGLVIEKISGQSLGDFLKNNIFKPLNLEHTTFPTDEQMPTPFAHGYSKQTLSETEEDVTFTHPSWSYAAGAVISTLSDLKIWTEALGTGKLLSKEAFKERLEWLTMPPNSKDKKYGLGIGYNHGWLTHTGELPGYNSMIAYLPEEKAIFVCLVNSDIPLKRDISSPMGEDKENLKKEVSPVTIISEEIFSILFPNNIQE